MSGKNFQYKWDRPLSNNIEDAIQSDENKKILNNDIGNSKYDEIEGQPLVSFVKISGNGSYVAIKSAKVNIEKADTDKIDIRLIRLPQVNTICCGSCHKPRPPGADRTRAE